MSEVLLTRCILDMCLEKIQNQRKIKGKMGKAGRQEKKEAGTPLIVVVVSPEGI